MIYIMIKAAIEMENKIAIEDGLVDALKSQLEDLYYEKRYHPFPRWNIEDEIIALEIQLEEHEPKLNSMCEIYMNLKRSFSNYETWSADEEWNIDDSLLNYVWKTFQY